MSARHSGAGRRGLSGREGGERFPRARQWRRLRLPVVGARPRVPFFLLLPARLAPLSSAAMAVAAEQEQQQFYLLLGNLLSPDNVVRKQAEVSDSRGSRYARPLLRPPPRTRFLSWPLPVSGGRVAEGLRRAHVLRPSRRPLQPLARELRTQLGGRREANCSSR